MSRSILIPLLLAPSLGTADNDWPRFRGPNGDNSLPEAGIVSSFPKAGPPVRWSIDVNAGYGGAAISRGEVFFMDRVDQEKDVVLCVGLADGKERWKWEYEVPGRISHPGSRVVPTVAEDAVYASSGFGQVYCIDRKTHQERWVVDVAKVFEARPPRFGYSVHPILHGDRCLIAPSGESVGLAALDRKTGEIVWRSQTIGDSHSSPVLVKLLGREMLVMPGVKDGSLLLSGFDPTDGRPLFQYTEKLKPGRFNPIPNISVIDKSTVFLTGGYGFGTRLLNLAEADGKVTVSKIAGIDEGATIHPVLKVEDRYFVSSGGGPGGRGGRGRPRGGRPRGGGSSGLICLDGEGDILWKTGTEPAVGGGSIINAGGIIICQDGADGSLRLIKPGPSYQELAKAKVFSKEPGNELWAPLALADGKLVMRSQAQMVCVDLSPTEVK